MYHQKYLYSENECSVDLVGSISLGSKAFHQLEPHSLEAMGNKVPKDQFEIEAELAAGTNYQQLSSRNFQSFQLLQVTTSSQPCVEGINAYYEAQEASSGKGGDILEPFT